MLRLIKSADDGTLGHYRRNLYQIYMMFMREGGIQCHIGIGYVVHRKGKTQFLKIKVRISSKANGKKFKFKFCFATIQI